jgi:hypothetical protein
VRRGDVDRGLASLRKCLGELRDSRYQLLVTRFKAALAEALIAAGRYAEGVHYTDEAVSWAQTRGELSHLPELLRLRGVLLSLPPTADNAGAQEYFLRSIELSRQQGAAAWELRATIDLASNLARSGWVGKAISLLKPASDRIIGGSDTADVKAARLLLLTLVNRRFAEGMDKYER